MYHYDARHRLWRKDIPGSGAIYVAYDELDRPVMEQDACGTLTYLRYDRLGRTTESGQITAAPGFDLKNSYNHSFKLSFAEKTVTIAEKSLTDKGAAYAFVTAEVPVLWLSRRRYDDYGADFALGQKHHNGSYLPRLPGAATGSKTRILGSKGDDAACYIETATYYDERGRAIHTVSTNPMGGADHTLSTYNWNGSLSEQRIEKEAGAAGPTTVVKRFDYYHSGDLRRVLHGVNPQKESDYTELARLSYDERGRLSTKHLHNGTMEEHYHYDVFDRLIGKRAVKINHTYSPTAVWNDEMAAYDTVYVPTPPDALFALSLAYDDVSQIAVPGAVPRYDGNISAISWQNRQETREYYRLDYNKLGNLTAAHSRNSAYDAAYRYDAHGNIEGLLRTTEWGDTLHHFDYHYRGNQLDSLTRRQVMTYTMRPGDMNRDGRVYTDDNIYWGGIDTLVSENERLPRREQGTAWKDYTFQLHKTQDENPYYLDANGDGIIDTLDAHAIKEHIGQYYEQIPARQGATYGYRYDESGNMIEDAYKNLKITYNSLNLPDTMTIAGRGQVVNTYLADGTLLKRAYYNAADSLVRQTDYGGMFLYENGSLDKIFTDEGYVSIENGKLRIENFTYNYVLTDHLGHTRSVVSSSGEVLQEHAYYPYGMEIGHLSKQIGSGTNYNYLYTQKEVLDYGGLNFTDHHARLWDYETGRWNGIDPALQMHSPYAGMGMNPMAFVDVDGQEAITLAALGVAALKGAIIASIASAVKYSSEAVAFETWDWGDFGKTVGVSAAMGAAGGAAGALGGGVAGSLQAGTGLSGAGIQTSIQNIAFNNGATAITRIGTSVGYNFTSGIVGGIIQRESFGEVLWRGGKEAFAGGLSTAVSTFSADWMHASNSKFPLKITTPALVGKLIYKSLLNEKVDAADLLFPLFADAFIFVSNRTNLSQKLFEKNAQIDTKDLRSMEKDYKEIENDGDAFKFHGITTTRESIDTETVYDVHNGKLMVIGAFKVIINGELRGEPLGEEYKYQYLFSYKNLWNVDFLLMNDY